MNGTVIIVLLYLTSMIVGGSIGVLFGLLFAFTSSHGIPTLVVLGSLSVMIITIVTAVAIALRD